MIDIIIVHSEKTRLHTDECIQSINDNSTYNVNIIKMDADLYETFNYNKILNDGAALGNNEYILFCNNDLYFHEQWDVNLITAMKSNNLQSASPLCESTYNKWWLKEQVPQDVNFGNMPGKYFTGWCFCWTRSLWEKLKLDETYQFWCSDNVTTDSLIANNIDHALIKSSRITHKYSKTLSTITDKELKEEWTNVTLKKYLNSKKSI